MSENKLTIKSVQTDGSGYFMVELAEKLPANTRIKVEAEVSNNMKAEKIITVKRDNKAPKLVEPKKLVINSYQETTIITGLLSEEGTINVLNDKTNSPVIDKVTTDKFGNFTVEIPQQLSGTKLVFEFEDTKVGTPNKSTKKVTVK